MMLHVLLTLAALLCTNIQANPLHISYDGEYPLTSTVSYFFTEDKELEFQELLANEDSLKWQKNGYNSINLGFGDGIYWFRTQIINENRLVSNWALELSYAPLDQIEIYLVKNTELIEYHFGGDTVPHKDKSIEYPHAVFPLVLEPNQPYILYVRVESSGAIQVPMTIWEWEKFNSQTVKLYLLQGLFFGFVIIMALYNFMIWLKERETIYLAYITYIIMLTVFQSALSGIGFQFIWPQQPWLNNFLPAISLLIALASLNFFIRIFFNMEKHSPVIDTILTKLFYLFLIFSISSIFLSHYLTLLITTTLAIINVSIIIAISIYMLNIKHPSAHYFSVAWSGLLIGAILLSLNKAGLIPVTYISEYTLQFGAAFEILILTLALAERMSITKKEALSLAIQVNQEREKTFLAELENFRIEKSSKQELENIVDEHLSIAHGKLQTISITDALTELYNRYYFNEHYKIEFKRAHRQKTEFSLILLDIDYFKKVNDSYGHPAGDICLKYIADCIKKGAARSSDICCRYGGEEFIIILSATSIKDAYIIAEEIRNKIKRKSVIWEGNRINLTASFGVSSTTPKINNAKVRQLLLNQTDQALYEAKGKGRDNVTIFGHDVI
jgi:diguanylate cyclase (GGDEF)-like protein